MTILLLIFFVFYLAFAIFFIKSTWATSSKIQRIIVLCFFILLPSWDYILGCVFYYASWPFFPKQIIYETAESDGLYYEGERKNKLNCATQIYLGKAKDIYGMAFARHDFERGYKYAEALIEKTINCPPQSSIDVPAVYRCIPLPMDPKNPKYIYQQCSPADHVLSEYVVRLNSFGIGSFEMNSMEIRNQASGKLMAEYKEIVRWGYFPFFMWLGWEHATHVRHSKPDETRLYDFQYDVLKVKKPL